MLAMIFVSRPWLVRGISIYFPVTRNFCQWSVNVGIRDEDFDRVEEPLKIMPKKSYFDSIMDEKFDFDRQERYSLPRRSLVETARVDAGKILEVLRQDCPGFDTTFALDDLGIRVSELIVREVLFGVLKSINNAANKTRYAQLGYEFFIWSGKQENYRHNGNSYHLLMKIFADCKEIRAMFSVADEMNEKGFPITGRTLIILICACGKARWPMKFAKTFIKSKAFKHRLSKHSYNAILYCLLSVNQYKLIEWVYQKMLADDHTPDTFTYNIVLCTKLRLRKHDHFYSMIAEMPNNGISFDLHTYNIILHVHGKSNNPFAARKLLNDMRKMGHHPSVLHFTTLIDGFSKARQMNMCEYFFNEMIKDRCLPDVVCYTVMITGYVVSGQLEKAQMMFDEMITKGQLPNVFTYNAMIRGFCMTGKFPEAFCMLKDMVSRGCNPNFTVYSTLEHYLRIAGKISKANKVRRLMRKKGLYVPRVEKFNGYRRC